MKNKGLTASKGMPTKLFHFVCFEDERDLIRNHLQSRVDQRCELKKEVGEGKQFI